MAIVPPRLDRRELAHLRAASQAAAHTLALVGRRLAAGQTTADIDRWVREDTARQGGTPSQLGYHGFPAAVCVSRNEVVCHGIPSASEHLQAGDIVNVDVTTALRGFHGDTSATFVIGAPSSDAQRLVDGARASLWAGISVVRAGAFLGDIGAAIEEVARRAGLSVVTEWAGHGIGRAMHLPPSVPHVGRKGTGPKLLAGMAFTIEPMLNLGGPHVSTLEDGWTVVTRDGRWSAQFEHTIVVTEGGCEVLTALPAEVLPAESLPAAVTSAGPVPMAGDDAQHPRPEGKRPLGL